MNLIIVSHCNFTGNSGMHAASLGNEMAAMGVDCVVCVPDTPESIESYGPARFRPMLYAGVVEHGVKFADNKGPDLVFAFTPRELVRKFTEFIVSVYGCQYAVHLEDNEAIILSNETGGKSFDELRQLPLGLLDSLIPEYRTHPVRSRGFLEGAAGITALMDTLLEDKPRHVPGLVFWPGFDKAFLDIEADSAKYRKRIGLGANEIALVYTGDIHASNVGEVRSLYAAAALLRQRGVAARIVKTGWNRVETPWIEEAGLDRIIVNLGFAKRSEVPLILGAADVLVQPGSAGPFNDYRFPSKLPEFLASGRPVALPASNIGRFVKDGEEAIVLRHGHSVEIADKVEGLLGDPERRRRIGAGGRAFAVRELQWADNAAKIKIFFEEILRGARRAAPAPPAKRQAATRKMEAQAELPVKLIAFYLPQYHPIPENDEWWGKGFTEWTNVARGKPLFEGHHQPHIPADFGFYDLRMPEIMDQQAELARWYGLHGFCFYYYWFDGRRLLERPVDTMLARGKPDMPFCYCWANENWTRRWDGSEKEMLVEQTYSEGWAERLIRDLIPVFKHPRYIRTADAPLFAVYRADQIPNPVEAAATWRRVCEAEGIPEIHLAAIQSFGLGDPRPYGFDSAIEFPPHNLHFLVDPKTMPDMSPEFEGFCEDYPSVVRYLLSQPVPEYIKYRGLMPSWDNTARRGNRAHIVVNSSPGVYETWLRYLVSQTLEVAEEKKQEPFVFINAWNEWAEGTHLEPDRTFGHRHLFATRSGLKNGVLDYYRNRGRNLLGSQFEEILEKRMGGRADLTNVAKRMVVEPAKKSETAVTPLSGAGRTRFKTSDWFSDETIQTLAARYGKFPVEPLSYGTVRDFVDSLEYLNPIATHNGDLKDPQRPWVFKAILSQVPRGGRLLEIGGGEPFVADMLHRLGYEVWIADPYDGSGNGPLEYEKYKAECPGVHIVRDLFGDQLALEPGSLDCVYSISVIEHIPDPGLMAVFRGMKKFLRPGGVHIHAVDHVHRGFDADSHLDNLRRMAYRSGASLDELDTMLARLDGDPETYRLSAESHNRWRGNVPYDQFPMRVCVSIQILGKESEIVIGDPPARA